MFNFIEEKLLQSRIIFIEDHIDDLQTNNVIKNLLYLDSVSDKDIHVYINSHGGSVTSGLAIYDTIRHLNCDVCTYCIGMAASIAAFILACGTPGKRYALENSDVMIHQPSSGATGQITDIIIHANHFQKVKDRIIRILSKVTKKSFQDMEKEIERDLFMDAKEALQQGYIDHII